MPGEKETHDEPEYARIIREMHDQKSDDFDPKTMTKYDASHPDYGKYLAYLRFLETREYSGAADRIFEIQEKIRSLKIESPHDIPENVEALEKQKKEALEKIEQVKEAATDYIETIYQMWSYYDRYSVDGKTLSEKRVKEVYRIDDRRKEAHNRLISLLNETNDHLRLVFGEQIIDQEQEIQGEALFRLEPYEHLDREYVANWAYQLVKYLGEKKLPDLSKEL